MARPRAAVALLVPVGVLPGVPVEARPGVPVGLALLVLVGAALPPPAQAEPLPEDRPAVAAD
ncbi:MAG: hypothetical protein ACRDQI_00320 [Pseudonocardiaceae bacterium]